MTVTVDQAKLVLNAFAATLQNNLISADLVTWNKFKGEMNDRNGLNVSEQVGPRYAVTQTVAAVQSLAGGVQDSVFGSEQYKVDRLFGSSMGWADFVKIRDIGDARESEAVKAAATQMAEAIDGYIMDVAGLASNNWTGSPANSVSVLHDIAAGYTRLKEEGVDDADLRAVLNYSDRQALSDTVVAYPAPDGLATGAFRRGVEGEIYGIPTMFTQQLPVITLGSRSATAAVNGAAQNVNYSAVAVSTSPGYYLSQTISIDGLTGTQTVKDGEVFTIAGVNAYDNRRQASLGRLQQFRVIGDFTASSGAIAALRIFPALIVPASGSGGDINVNTAHATVTAAPADDAVITWLGTASTAYRPRMVIQKGAIIAHTADLIMPATGKAVRKELSKVPVSVRMWQDSSFTSGDHRVRFDVALSANVRDRRRIVRINGQ